MLAVYKKKHVLSHTFFFSFWGGFLSVCGVLWICFVFFLSWEIPFFPFLISGLFFFPLSPGHGLLEP
ncbi:hypothetical protein QBC38DRAFT_155745 [Podospora fimiseda]|uniref:Uncharacterized protein n=1 Tax=Podospora fimiseda TaxID=252190 RepID=A0AAN7H0A3_9PEZI|nr:hypothetical protein QBC38DRAFT_155745 [Podospora fimiseda]